MDWTKKKEKREWSERKMLRVRTWKRKKEWVRKEKRETDKKERVRKDITVSEKESVWERIAVACKTKKMCK